MPTYYTPRAKTTHLSKKEFGAFLLSAANGAAITYAVSNKFASACETDKELAAIRAMAWDGPCLLVQRRVPTSDMFEYIAIRSGRDRRFLRPKPEFYQDYYFEAYRQAKRKQKRAISDALEYVE